MFLAKTQQATALRVLIESLRELLTEANFHLACDGIRLTAMDPSQVTLAFTHLFASEFIQYECDKDYIVGINLPALHRIIKNVNNHDTITFTYTENGDDLVILIENPDKDFSMTCNMKLMDIDEGMLDVPERDVVECVVSMPSTDFQRYIRDIKDMGDEVEFSIVGSTLEIKCRGDSSDISMLIGETPNGLSIQKKADFTMKQRYSLRYLNMFTKATNLCNAVDLYFNNDYPLILKYLVASLGEVKFCLAPKIDEE